MLGDSTLVALAGARFLRDEQRAPALLERSAAFRHEVLSRFERKETDSFHRWAARRSFDLFMGDPDARNKQTHWKAVPGGYVESKNFGVEFRGFLRRGAASEPRRPPVPRAETPPEPNPIQGHQN